MSDAESFDALLIAVGARVRELRLKAEMTQEDLARSAGMSTSYAWRVEDGRQNLSLRSISRIALALDVPMAALFEGIKADPATLGTRPYKRPDKR